MFGVCVAHDEPAVVELLHDVCKLARALDSGGAQAVEHAGAVGVADAPASRYTFPAAGTVYDTRTRLTWQRATDTTARAWPDAKTYCGGLAVAGGGWRLPTISELRCLVDPTVVLWPIDPTAFPDTVASPTWSATPAAFSGAAGFAWTVDFGSGATARLPQTCQFMVRCVR